MHSSTFQNCLRHMHVRNMQHRNCAKYDAWVVLYACKIQYVQVILSLSTNLTRHFQAKLISIPHHREKHLSNIVTNKINNHCNTAADSRLPSLESLEIMLHKGRRMPRKKCS